MIYDVIIIGAGVSGLFAGNFLNQDLKTIILEKKQRPGLKLLITGNNQCNITSTIPISSFISKYGKNGKFLIPSFNLFNNKDIMNYFLKRGIKLEYQGEKVFPYSRNSSDVLNTLIKELNNKNIDIYTKTEVTNIKFDENLWKIYCQNNKTYNSHNIIISTGGCSYPKTGSDGFFFNILKNLGLEIINPEPALTSVDIRNHYLSAFSGFSFQNVEVTINRDKKKILKENGDILITHTGFSGPLILNNSRYVKNNDIIKINHTLQNTDKIREIIKNDIKNLKEVFNRFGFSKSLISFFENKFPDIDFSANITSISSKNIQIIAELLTSSEFVIEKKAGFNKAMVTKGGLSLKEIDPKSMECKKYKGLYVIGEVLDIDGDTGGFNIQAAASGAFNASFSINSKHKI